MNGFMNPQKNRGQSVSQGAPDWNFVECEGSCTIKKRKICETSLLWKKTATKIESDKWSHENVNLPFIYFSSSSTQAALVARHAPEVGPDPIRIKCPSCSKYITSEIEAETYSKTHFCAFALFMTLVWVFVSTDEMCWQKNLSLACLS